MHEIEIKNIEEEKDKSLNVNKFHKKLKWFNECMDYIYGYPMFLLENIVLLLIIQLVVLCVYVLQ